MSNFELKASLLDDNKIIKRAYVIDDYIATGISIRKDLKKKLLKFSSENKISKTKIFEEFALTLMETIDLKEIQQVNQPKTKFAETIKKQKCVTTSFYMREKDFDKFTNFCRKLRISRSFAISYCIDRYLPE